MNKQIDKLFEQALEEFKAENKYATIIVPDPLKEKFAEMIVRECLIIVEPTQHHQAFAQSYLGDVEGLELLDNKAKQIKQHFGVENEKT
jgi:hypothetical protein